MRVEEQSSTRLSADELVCLIDRQLKMKAGQGKLPEKAGILYFKTFYDVL